MFNYQIENLNLVVSNRKPNPNVGLIGCVVIPGPNPLLPVFMHFEHQQN